MRKKTEEDYRAEGFKRAGSMMQFNNPAHLYIAHLCDETRRKCEVQREKLRQQMSVLSINRQTREGREDPFPCREEIDEVVFRLLATLD